jgi:DNA-binding NarL/FixJ family response regulator
VESLLGQVAALIPQAWQDPERTFAVIRHGENEYRGGDCASGPAKRRESIEVGSRKVGYVEVSLRNREGDSEPLAFLTEEGRLLKAIAVLLGNVIEKKEAEVSLERNAEDLRQRTIDLENKNTALREVLSQIAEERQRFQDQVRLNIEQTIFPVLERLENGCSEDMPRYISVMRSGLQDIASSFSVAMIRNPIRLSPREVEIANLIKNGLCTKEIASLLQLSVLTVEKHRHNIRKKLQIDNEKVNLMVYLRGL